MKRVKFNSLKKEEVLGRSKNKFIAPKEPVLLLTRGGKTKRDGGQPVSRLAGITRPSAFISEKSNSYYLRSFSSPLPSCSKPTCFSP